MSNSVPHWRLAAHDTSARRPLPCYAVNSITCKPPGEYHKTAG